MAQIARAGATTVAELAAAGRPALLIPFPDATGGHQAANARALNNWLMTDWLADYPHNNVAVFDFYNVLTSNGGAWNVNDLGAATGNHHRYHNGAVQYVTDQGGNTAAYPDGGNDDHDGCSSYCRLEVWVPY